MRLNGKQTIYQMIQLAERIRERGGEPEEPLWYKHEYLRRLDLRIADRIDGLRQGTIPPDDLLVHGARSLAGEPRRSRPAALPGQRHRRGLRQARGRAAGPHPLLRAPDLRRPGRLQDVLQEDGHRADHPRERHPRRTACSPSATATSRSRTPRRSAAWPSPWPATRPTTAPVGWTSGNASGSRASAPTS